MDMLLVVLALIGIFALVNMAVGSTKKAKAVARKRTKTVKIVSAMTIEDKVMMRAGYASYNTITLHGSDGDHHYLVQYNNGVMTPIYEVVMDGNEFDLVLVNQEYSYAS